MTKRKNDDTLQRTEELKAQRARELQAIVDRLTGELERLEEQLAATDDQSEQASIETEIVHFTMALNQLRRGAGSRPNRRRKLPEAGLPVPADPPEGPQPMQGGAAAPLDSEA